MKSSARLNTALLVCAALFVLVPYFSVIFNASVALLYRDLSHTALPTKALWLYGVEELGRVPHWNPYSLSGTPFLANSNPGPLYPLNGIFYFLRSSGLPRALFFFILLHHVLIFMGGYFLLRELQARGWLAVVGAWALALGGFALSSDNLLHILGAQLGVVFFFFFWARVLRRPQWLSSDLLFAGLALAWPMYSSDPQYTYLAGVAGWIWAWRTLGFLPALRGSAFLFLAMVLASGPQLFPTLGFLPSTGRGISSSLSDLQFWSLHPVRFWEGFLPLPFGHSVNPNEYWGAQYLNSGGMKQPFIFSFYPGLFATFFLMLGSVEWARKRHRPADFFWPGLFLLGALLAMGEFSPVPLFALFAKVIPLWSGFRHPERLVYWLSFAWIVLSVLAAEKVLRLPAARLRALLKIAMALFAAIYLGLFIWMQAKGVSLAPLLHAVVVVAGFGALLWLRRPNASYLLLLLAALDLGLTAEKLVWPQPIAIAEEARLPWLQKLNQDRAAQAGAFAKGAASRFYAIPGGEIDFRYVPSQDFSTQVLFSEWARAQPNTSAYWRLEDVRGFYGLQPRRAVDLWNLLSVHQPNRLLDLFSVRYLLKVENLEPIVLVNRSALPFVGFFEKVEQEASEQEALARIQAPNWNLQHVLLVETDAQEAPARAEWEILSVEKKWDDIQIRLRAQRAGGERFLLLNETFDPIWRVRTGKGTNLKLVRANAWAQATLLPSATTQGEELTLQFTYRDPLYFWGLVAFAGWLLAMLFVVAFKKRKFSGNVRARL